MTCEDYEEETNAGIFERASRIAALFVSRSTRALQRTVITVRRTMASAFIVSWGSHRAR